MVRRMRPGSVIVDVAIDQGGCFETSQPTTHAEPTYVDEGVVHYCVANMPGAVARTSTIALGNATLPFVLALADKGWRAASQADPHLLPGLNVHAGKITCEAVAEALSLPCRRAPGRDRGLTTCRARRQHRRARQLQSPFQPGRNLEQCQLEWNRAAIHELAKLLAKTKLERFQSA